MKRFFAGGLVRFSNVFLILLLLIGGSVPAFAKPVESTSFPEWFDPLLPYESGGQHGYLIPFTWENVEPEDKLSRYEFLIKERFFDPNYFLIFRGGSFFNERLAYFIYFVPVSDYRFTQYGDLYTIESSQNIECIGLDLRGDTFYLKHYSSSDMHYLYQFFWTNYSDAIIPSSFPVLSDVDIFGLTDDKELPSKPPKPDLGGEEPDTGFLSWLKKIWEWLTSFWDKLKELLLGLFVPKDGFFGDWFEEIRSAFDKKLGGLGTLFDRIKELLSNPGEASDIKIALPVQSFGSGSKVVEISILEFLRPFLNFIRPILTSIIVILTIIKCYKRVISLANT